MQRETAKAEALGGREEQQDRVEILSGRDAVLLVVADGLGGHVGGARAAATVIDTARDLWAEQGRRPEAPERFLDRVCREAHRRISALAGDAGESPHSTCVLLHLDGAAAHWAHVGDSRIYRFRDGSLAERSRDHSVVQMLVDMGRIDEDEMGSHPDQNRLTQSLGGSGVPQPDFGSCPVEEGDAFLLCSDGLWESAAVGQMIETLRASNLERALSRLVAGAAERAGPRGDNIAAAAARCGSTPSRGRWTLLGSFAVALMAAGLFAAAF